VPGQGNYVLHARRRVLSLPETVARDLLIVSLTVIEHTLVENCYKIDLVYIGKWWLEVAQEALSFFFFIIQKNSGPCMFCAINQNSGLQVREMMNLARLECGHSVEVPPSLQYATRCAHCQQVHRILFTQCGHCGQCANVCHHLYKSKITPNCLYRDCKRRAYWSNAGYCKTHSNTKLIESALQKWENGHLCQDNIDTIMSFARFM
jgi:hypothetical protein